MIFNFFGRSSSLPEWHLFPSKYSSDNPNNYGGKVILPQSILEDLIILHIQTPYTFQIKSKKSTHCGVLEFTAEENNVIVPSWMFNQLELSYNKEVVLSIKTLNMGRHLELQPHSTVFLDVDNPKLELEGVLRNYPTLSINDQIECLFEEYGIIKFTVVNVEPSDEGGIYIVDTDLSVDFCEPLGYKEKLESEKTVNKYLEIVEDKGDVKIIRMKYLGLSFNTKDI